MKAIEKLRTITLRIIKMGHADIFNYLLEYLRGLSF